MLYRNVLDTPTDDPATSQKQKFCENCFMRRLPWSCKRRVVKDVDEDEEEEDFEGELVSSDVWLKLNPLKYSDKFHFIDETFFDKPARHRRKKKEKRKRKQQEKEEQQEKKNETVCN